MKNETLKSVAALKSFFVEAPEVYPNDWRIMTVRTTKAVAEELLIENASVIKGGNVRYFQIKNIGFSVFEVKLRDIGKVNTFLNKDWEKRVVDNTVCW
jgi:hypothetical protein